MTSWELVDIIEAAKVVARYIDGYDLETFLSTSMACDAVLLRLTNIGEACARISQETREAYPEIPWQKVKAFRNLAVHAYFSVDWQVVWNLAEQRVPELAQQVSKVLDDLTRKANR